MGSEVICFGSPVARYCSTGIGAGNRGTGGWLGNHTHVWGHRRWVPWFPLTSQYFWKCKWIQFSSINHVDAVE